MKSIVSIISVTCKKEKKKKKKKRGKLSKEEFVNIHMEENNVRERKNKMIFKGNKKLELRGRG